MLDLYSQYLFFWICRVSNFQTFGRRIWYHILLNQSRKLIMSVNKWIFLKHVDDVHLVYIKNCGFVILFNTRISFFLRGPYQQVIRGSSFFLMSFKNRYSIGNNVWKFQVSTMKIVSMAHIWSLGVTRIIMSQRHGKGA